ncbi:hypothetical protein AAES_81512 [Amazona aestiva]|uniref:Uncharacterized protein n=1 Tax=Amazona aestiva TaxID=12930 RepID=A0A0Q3TLB3_AMAAE|nr:hypothetical protein AAES_81512 [Amazona aestiva]
MLTVGIRLGGEQERHNEAHSPKRAVLVLPGLVHTKTGARAVKGYKEEVREVAHGRGIKKRSGRWHMEGVRRTGAVPLLVTRDAFVQNECARATANLDTDRLFRSKNKPTSKPSLKRKLEFDGSFPWT